MIALALSGAAACEARLEGAPCPCLEPQYTCVDEICRRAHDAGPDFPDAGDLPADGGLIPDGGGSPDALVSDADASF